MSDLDSVDKLLLGAIQSNFPVCEEPFARIGKEIGLQEQEVIRRIESLMERKIIRRFGAVFDSRKLGYVSTLVGAKIPDPAGLPAVAERVNKFSEVTHNYQRADVYNLWFTLIAASRERIEAILDEIRSLPEVEEVRDLPAEELYKIKVDFKPA